MNKIYAIVGATMSESGTPLTPILSQYGLKSSLEEARKELKRVKQDLLNDMDEEYVDLDEDDMSFNLSDGDNWYVFKIIENIIDYKK